MSTTVASNEFTMIQLGMNPDLLEDYAEVSLEPVSFEEEGSLGWATCTTAGRSTSMADPSKSREPSLVTSICSSAGKKSSGGETKLLNGEQQGRKNIARWDI
ncbi:hypothetical protein [Stenotrophomonas maltophilia]|uniref:hypothetical protein n=1 Tax=Stenotrophomonas maltophilia TaxID=40324 RepID=UPI0013D9E08A|nr:hypothetical protein [Stenotrophomonas maltophilia]